MSAMPVTLNRCDAIIPGKIYLGDHRAASSQELLDHLGVTHVVNAAREVPNYFPRVLVYCNCSLNDDLTQQVEFRAPLQFIRSALSQGKVVLVHCAAGISRSATLVVGYLMQAQRIPLAEALAKVKKARPHASPNANFLKQLKRLQVQLGIPAAAAAHPLGGAAHAHATAAPIPAPAHLVMARCQHMHAGGQQCPAVVTPLPDGFPTPMFCEAHRCFRCLYRDRSSLERHCTKCQHKLKLKQWGMAAMAPHGGKFAMMMVPVVMPVH